MNRALQDLLKFIAATNTDEERHEIRLYVQENAVPLAQAFDVEPDVVLANLASIEADEELAPRLVKAVKRVKAEGREMRAEEREREAQASADVLGAASYWEGEAVVVDLVSLLATALTRPKHLLVFMCDAFTVAVYMTPLLDLARLDRMDLTAYVDAEGLHVRWGRRGGLNLKPRTDPHASRVTVSIAQRVEVAAWHRRSHRLVEVGQVSSYLPLPFPATTTTSNNEYLPCSSRGN